MACLYIANLDPQCSEALLYQKFAPIGNLLNIRICKDITTGRSLGYGFVNYTSKSEAERALNELNFTEFKGRCLRMMWADKNVKNLPSDANVFVKNLAFNIDEKSLYVIFASYGEIMSLKLATDEKGVSKGHAFVQYADEESANKAIKDLDNKLLYGKVVCVTKFVPKEIRLKPKSLNYQNVYIKNFDSDIKDKDLVEMCEKFGEITSAKVMVDESGKSKNFGFVCFESAESAQKAVQELNGKLLNGRKLFADRAKKKAERQKEIMESLKQRLHITCDQGNIFNYVNSSI